MPVPTSRRTCSPWLMFCVLNLAAFAGAPVFAQDGAATHPSAADEVLRVLQEDGLENALAAMGSLVDQGLSPAEITESNLPAAAGGLFRALSQRSTGEQYDLLVKWSLPTADRPTVRVLTTPVPSDAPPKAFARAIGARPRDHSFPLADVGGVRGLFCSGWMLVQAADDIGRLGRLIDELQTLVGEGVAGAHELRLLAQVMDRRGNAQSVHAYLAEERPAADEPAEPVAFSGDDLVPLAIAAAALSHDTLGPSGESVLQRLSERPSPWRPLLRIAHATAVQRNLGESPVTVLYENRLKHWVPVTDKTAVQSSAGVPDAMWLTHEDHVLHLAGGGDDVLYCRYPLTGTFDFVCETQEGGAIGTDGGLVYGGLHFEALGRTNQLTVWDADGNHPVTKPCPFVRHETTPTFNRVSIRATDASVAFEANFHPMWFDGEAAQASPWLGLRSRGSHRPVFRNLRIDGAPEIPRQVNLTQGDQLRGWESGFFGARQSPFSEGGTSAEGSAGAGATPEAVHVDWQIRSGILTGQAAEQPASAMHPGLLRYQRPLLEDESITYEFEHRTDQVTVHPAVGRLAFLLRPDGVQVRWITDGRWDWTGLSSDHTLSEPLSRRGPRSLPLNQGDWNRVTIARVDGKLHLTLNDELIYQRALDFEGSTQFGLYRETRHEEVRLRNAVLTGDWPEQLPEDFLANPVTLARNELPIGDQRVRGASIGEETIASNAPAVRRQLAAAAREDRFESLCRWVLVVNRTVWPTSCRGRSGIVPDGLTLWGASRKGKNDSGMVTTVDTATPTRSVATAIAFSERQGASRRYCADTGG